MMNVLRDLKVVFGIYTSLALLIFIGCQNQGNSPRRGADVTQSFLAEYAGLYQEVDHGRSDDGERVRIGGDGAIEVLRIRQVGMENNPDVPYPTVCSYWLIGKIRNVTELSHSHRTRENPENGETFLAPHTHEIVFAVSDIRLSDELKATTTENPHCHNFVSLERKRSRHFTLPVEPFAQSLRFHTSGGSDYTGGERTESTLDEVFTRVSEN